MMSQYFHYPAGTERKLNVHKTYRRRPSFYVRSIYVLCQRSKESKKAMQYIQFIFCRYYVQITLLI